MGLAFIEPKGSGVHSDNLTATAGDVLKGRSYIGKDTNDEIGTGALELTGNAADGDVMSQKTFYNANPSVKRNGSLQFTGTASPSFVSSGKTFYSNSKTKQTGTCGVLAAGNVSAPVTPGAPPGATSGNVYAVPVPANGIACIYFSLKNQSDSYPTVSLGGFPSGFSGGLQSYIRPYYDGQASIPSSIDRAISGVYVVTNNTPEAITLRLTTGNLKTADVKAFYVT